MYMRLGHFLTLEEISVAHTRTMNMSQGRPMKLLALFAIPLLIGNLFQQAYNLADSIIVGQFIGAGALAAVGATDSISFLFSRHAMASAAAAASSPRNTSARGTMTRCAGPS